VGKTIEERLSAIEAKLGIEPNLVGRYGLFWDDELVRARAAKLRFIQKATYPYTTPDGTSWKHFLPFTPEELDRFRTCDLFPES